LASREAEKSASRKRRLPGRLDLASREAPGRLGQAPGRLREAVVASRRLREAVVASREANLPAWPPGA